MGDEAHVRLVDPHAERDGGDDDHRVLAHERDLVAPALLRAHARVVGERVVAPLPQPPRRLLDLAAREAVDDARVAAVLGVEEARELLARAALRHDGVADVRAVEAAHEDPRVPEPEPLGDLAPRGLVRGGGERDARHAGIALVQHRELEVLGPEVVAPLRDAVRLVDGEERDAQAVEQREGALAHQPLRRDVEQVERPCAGAALDRPDFVEGEGRVQVCGAHPGLEQRVHLVLHQRDEGRDDHRDAVPEQGGDLVAQGLAAAGGHEHQAVAPARDVLDDRLLLASERAVSEDAAERLARRPGHGAGCRRHRRAGANRHVSPIPRASIEFKLPTSPTAVPKGMLVFSELCLAQVQDRIDLPRQSGLKPATHLVGLSS